METFHFAPKMSDCTERRYNESRKELASFTFICKESPNEQDKNMDEVLNLNLASTQHKLHFTFSKTGP